MNGIKFYLEYPTNKDKRKGTRKEVGNHDGNVIAVIDDTRRINAKEVVSDAIGAVFFNKNSFVGTTSVADSYLREKCKRISEKQAREIHPRMFNFLDD